MGILRVPITPPPLCLPMLCWIAYHHYIFLNGSVPWPWHSHNTLGSIGSTRYQVPQVHSIDIGSSHIHAKLHYNYQLYRNAEQCGELPHISYSDLNIPLRSLNTIEARLATNQPASPPSPAYTTRSTLFSVGARMTLRHQKALFLLARSYDALRRNTPLHSSEVRMLTRGHWLTYLGQLE